MRKLTVIIAFAFVVAGCKTNESPLIGTWKFVADQQLDSLGNVTKQDSNVGGQLIYTSEGSMSAQLLWRQKREPLMSDSIMGYDGNSSGLGLGINTWTPEQNSIWIDTYDAYFGEYKVDWENGVVTHKVNGNLRPEKNLTEYKRKFVLKGDTLWLRSADPQNRWQVLWTRKNK